MILVCVRGREGERGWEREGKKKTREEQEDEKRRKE